MTAILTLVKFWRVAVFVLAIGGAWLGGFRYEHNRWAAADAIAKQRISEADERIRNVLEATIVEQTGRIDTLETQLTAQVRDIEVDSAKAPASDRCIAGPERAKRLRSLGTPNHGP